MGRKIDIFRSHFWKWDGSDCPCRIGSVAPECSMHKSATFYPYCGISISCCSRNIRLHRWAAWISETITANRLTWHLADYLHFTWSFRNVKFQISVNLHFVWFYWFVIESLCIYCFVEQIFIFFGFCELYLLKCLDHVVLVTILFQSCMILCKYNWKIWCLKNVLFLFNYVKKNFGM